MDVVAAKLQLFCVIVTLVSHLQAASISCSKQKESISAFSGGTAHLPCKFSPTSVLPAEGAKVSWQKRDGMKELVVHFQNGQEDEDRQDVLYFRRTHVQRDWFKKGDVGLKLKDVKIEDAGLYTCWVTLLPLGPDTQHQCCEVELAVTARVAVTDVPEITDYNWIDIVIGWAMLIIAVAALIYLPLHSSFIKWFGRTCHSQRDLLL